MTLDKLEGIRGDLIRTETGWKSWTFTELVEALRLWVERNPLQPTDRDGSHNHRDTRRDKVLTTKDFKQQQCIYCEDETHRSAECDKVSDVVERKKILSQKRRCYNCTGEKHRASDCKSKGQCLKCKRRHHTSICDKVEPPRKALCQATEKDVVYPVVWVEVNGVRCCALLDTGSGNSYGSTTLMNLTKTKPVRQEYKTIEMMLHTTTKKIDVYDVEVADVEGKFKMCTEVNRVDRDVLLTLKNRKYNELIAKHDHLKGVRMNDQDEKPLLPVHLILGASDISRMKTSTPARVGGDGTPVGEETRIGWTIMSPGHEMQHSYLLFSRTSHDDYMQLCSLDVLGLEDRAEGDQESVYQEFKNSLPPETKFRNQTPRWKKVEDTLSVAFPQTIEEPTKRVILRTMAKVYDPLGIAAPILLTAKVIFRDICDRKLGLDTELPKDLKRRWERWLRGLLCVLRVPRCIPQERETITEVALHGFADASILGCCAVVHAVVNQGNQVSQGLLVSKARLAKRNLTIPRLELVSCHMVSNLLYNTSKTLRHLPITRIYAWTDSTVCLQ